MRTIRGLPLAESSPWVSDLQDLSTKGLVTLSEDRWMLTPRGRLLADTVAEIFV